MLQKLNKRHSTRLNPKNSTGGFTIVETLIVLAIAGLIMLIVFLAVPALERTSRNTQRKNDVSNILSGLNNYVNDNAGSLPTDNSAFQTALFNGTGSNCSTSTGNVKLGYYACANVTFTPESTGTVPTPTASAENVYVYNYVGCNGNTPVAAQSSRAIAVIYWLETSSSTQEQCEQS